MIPTQTQLLIDLVAVILTLMVLSRIIGDNPLFRISQYLFVGVSLGYAFVIVWHQVLWPQLRYVAGGNSAIFNAVPLLLGLLLLPRIIGKQTLSWLANIPLGFIFSVGAALALVGALGGTLLPQVVATIQVSLDSSPLEIIGSLILVAGVIAVLSYFYFTVPEQKGLARLSAFGARVGRWWLMATFGFFLAGALLTYLAALNDRLSFLVGWVVRLLMVMGLWSPA